MAKQSAGLLLYRRKGGQIEVLLGHPGGPFWAKKDKGAWSLPKGEFDEGEDSLTAAKREFGEEIGQQAPDGEYQEIGTVKLKSGKTIYGWALEADMDVSTVMSNTFEIEWPPKSGKMQEFPEIDRAQWLTLAAAKEKMHTGQSEFIDRLATQLGANLPEQASLF